MELTVHGHNLEISTRIEEYVEKKVKRLNRKLPDLLEARVDLSVENTRSAAHSQIAQLTLRTERGTLLRAEERAIDLFTAIDAVLEKIQRQIERYKGKGRHERQRQLRRSAAAAREQALAPALPEVEAAPSLVVRRKHFAMTPMSEEAAIEQLELLDHPFFVFFNAEEKAMQVAYRRGDGSYGLLIPEME
jgi:putative sigma-54 modulation protein